MPFEDLPVAEFGFPGSLRDQLVAAILAGSKTTTSSLVVGYEKDGEPLPSAGDREAVADSSGSLVAVIETTGVRVLRLADVDLAHALGEGEGYASVAEWRAGHERFWHSADVRGELGDPDFTVDDDTLIVAQAFRVAAIASRTPPTMATARVTSTGMPTGRVTSRGMPTGNVKIAPDLLRFALADRSVFLRPHG